MGSSKCCGATTKNLYWQLLNDHGERYEGDYCAWLRRLAILWIAIIQQAEELDLVRGPHEGLYELGIGGLSWHYIYLCCGAEASTCRHPPPLSRAKLPRYLSEEI